MQWCPILCTMVSLVEAFQKVQEGAVGRSGQDPLREAATPLRRFHCNADHNYYMLFSPRQPNNAGVHVWCNWCLTCSVSGYHSI